MMTLIAAAAAAAAQPAAAPASAEHQMPMMQMGQSGEHKAMDCCKHCCNDMAGEQDGHAAEHDGHPAQ